MSDLWEAIVEAVLDGVLPWTAHSALALRFAKCRPRTPE